MAGYGGDQRSLGFVGGGKVSMNGAGTCTSLLSGVSLEPCVTWDWQILQSDDFKVNNGFGDSGFCNCTKSHIFTSFSLLKDIY